jgi:hypothetical protein
MTSFFFIEKNYLDGEKNLLQACSGSGHLMDDMANMDE